jgi:hypothetical protein
MPFTRERDTAVRWRAAGFVALLLALALAEVRTRAGAQEATHMTPPPQPPLAVIADRNLEPVRELFNRLADRPRVLAMFSPT